MTVQPFTLDGYASLVCALLEHGYQTVDFEDARADRKHLVLRHDVDMCLDRAVKMATVEARLGVKSSYYVLVRTEMYTVTSTRSRSLLTRLLGLSREIGLHFDAAGLPDQPEILDAAAAADCALLESVMNRKVRSVSFHRPAPSLQGLSRPIAGRLHTYEPRFFKDMGYCSDSEGRFRFGHPLDHEAVKQSRALQMVTHPIWWVAQPHESVLDKLERFRKDRDQLLREELAANCKPYREFGFFQSLS